MVLMAVEAIDIYSLLQQALLIASVGLGVAIRFLTQRTRAPSSKIMCIFQIASFTMSMCWIYILAEIIVALLELFGLITGVPSSLLGLTILSWGNSVGDAFASISIAKAGLGEMAVTGCIAGPAFNLMFGLGMTTLLTNLAMESSRGIRIDIHQSEGISSLATILSALLVHFALCFIVCTNGFKVKQVHAKLIFGIYAVSIPLIGMLSIF